MVRAPDLQFGGLEFKSCSDRLLDLLAVVSGILVNNDPVTFDLIIWFMHLFGHNSISPKNPAEGK